MSKFLDVLEKVILYNTEKGMWICAVCDKEFEARMDILEHIEDEISKHGE